MPKPVDVATLSATRSLSHVHPALPADSRSPRTGFLCFALGALLALTLGGCTTSSTGQALAGTGFSPAANANLAATLADPVVEPTDKLRVQVFPVNGGKSKHLLEAHDIIGVRFAFGRGDYHIMAGDEVNVQFAENSKMDVRAVVRPDGKMTFPNLGDLMVAGRTPPEAAADIAQLYGSRMNKPDNTVTVVTPNTEVIDSLASELTVRPDGIVSIPLLGEFKAAGLTPGELALQLTTAASARFQNLIVGYVTTRERATSQEMVRSELLGFDKVVDVASDGRLVLPEIGAVETRGLSLSKVRDAITAAAHRAYTNPLQVSVTLEASERRSIFVAGDVNKPGKYAWAAGMSSMKAVALAGGTTNEGNLRGIVLIHYEPNGSVTVYKVNNKDVITHKCAFTDVSLSPQDVVYIPKTVIGQADLFVQQYIEKLVPFTRSINYSYSTQPGLPIF